MANGGVVYDVSLLTDYDVYLFKEGNHLRLHEKMGSHMIEVEGVKGTYFAVWALNAERASVIGDFNGGKRGILTGKVIGTADDAGR